MSRGREEAQVMQEIQKTITRIRKLVMGSLMVAAAALEDSGRVRQERLLVRVARNDSVAEVAESAGAGEKYRSLLYPRGFNTGVNRYVEEKGNVHSWLVLLLVLLGTAGWGSCCRRVSGAYPTPLDTRTARVERGDIAMYVSATGTLNPVITVQVGTQVSGTIAKLFADFNAVVHEGQPLAQLDQATFRAKLTEAEARLEKARAEVKNAVANVQNVRAAIENAQAEVASQRANLERARVAVVDAKRVLDRAHALFERTSHLPQRTGHGTNQL